MSLLARNDLYSSPTVLNGHGASLKTIVQAARLVEVRLFSVPFQRQNDEQECYINLDSR